MTEESATVAGFFVTGGTLPPGSPSYIERVADQELYESLLAGRYAYVLNARQMGKSSLAVRTLTKLRQAGVRTGFVDLTGFGGATSSAEQWYSGLLAETGRALGMSDAATEYLRNHKHLGPARRFLAFLQDQILAKTDGPIVLMIDEIDATRSLPFPTDELFTGIRQLYNARASEPDLNRLTFCLLGAALPGDLIRDLRTTPFNIGTRIELKDFTIEELRALEPGIDSPRAKQIVERIHYWTNGHPFLTQSLCAEIVACPKQTVDQLVEVRYLQARSRESDTNLADVANRLLRRGDPEFTEADASTALSLYLEMLRHGIPYDEANPACARIKMSGIASLKDSRLTSRNRIYATAFDKAWVKDNMPHQEARRQRRAYWIGVARASAVSLVVVAAVGSSAMVAIREKEAAQTAESLAKRESARAIQSEARMKVAEKQAEDHASAESAARIEAQRAGALANERAQEARDAQQDATRSAQLATRNESEARRLLYESNMSLAGNAAGFGSGVQLESILAGSGAPASRGWEYDHYQALIHDSTELPPQDSYSIKLAFSPQGRLVAKLAPNVLEVWDLRERRLVAKREPRNYPGGIDCDLARGGSRAVVAKAQGRVEILSPEDLSPIREVRSDEAALVGPRLSDNGGLAECSVGGQQRVLNLQTGQLAPPRRLGPDNREHVLLPDGDALEGTNGAILRWRFSDPARAGIVWYACGKQGTNVWAASLDASVVAFSDANGSMQLVSAQDGRRICPPVSQSASVSAICFSPDDDYVASGSMDGSIYVRRVSDGTLLRILQTRQTSITALAFSRDGKVAYGTASGQIGVFQPFSFGSAAGSVRPVSTPITSMELSPDKSRLAISVLGRGQLILDTDTGKTVGYCPMGSWAGVPSFSPDGKRLASSEYREDGYRTVKIWDLATGRRHDFEVFRANTPGLAKFSQDGKRILATAGTGYYSTPDTSSIVEYDAQTGKELFRSAPESGGVACLVASPDHRTLLVGRDADRSQIVDEKTLRVLSVLEADGPAEGDFVCSACFSPDGMLAVLGRQNGRVSVYNASTGKLLAGWLAHTARVMGVAFARRGRTLLTVSDDHRLRMWAADGWRSVGEEHFPDEIQSLVLSPKDDSAFMGDTIGTVFARRVLTPSMGNFVAGDPPAKAPTLSWDKTLTQSRKSQKPVLVFAGDGFDDRQQLLRLLASDPAMRAILNRHFLVLAPWPNELVTYKGKPCPPSAIYAETFGGFAASSIWILGSPSIPPTSRYAGGRALHADLPSNSDGIEDVVKVLKQSAPAMTALEITEVRKRLSAILGPQFRTEVQVTALAAAQREFQTRFDQGDLKGAMLAANRLIDLNPYDPESYADRARVYAGLEKWDASMADFKRSEGLARHRYNGWFPNVQAELMIQGNLAEYRRRFQTVLRNDSEMFYDFERARIECEGYGMDAGGSKDPEATARRLEHLYARNLAEIDSWTVKIYFGLTLMRAGRTKDAERSILTGLKEWAGSPKGKEMNRMALALVLAHRGDRAGAQKEFDRAEAAAEHRTDGQLISGCGPNSPDYPAATAAYAVLRRETASLLKH